MFSFLFFISFLLHILTLIIIFQLIKKINTLQQVQSPSEIMDLFDTYLEEIKAENEYLQKTLNNNPEDNKQNNSAEKVINPPHSVETEQPFNVSDQEIPKDEMEASLQARILHLYQNGYAAEEIAKQLDCGKTEAALVIKLHTKSYK
ncbi:DUF6115 domain-containing protein [Virgibacillus halodenitrificans]|uniref:Uncharacterized protein n=2 Tax=Virgibacillus halodenitrificans TaxID=1482 RepID=A0AAC9IZC1_VIRHA|nr:DUF6115 domain-containing protein [Virgibacillus halodenitrificans]APC48606.1 hypothetical protein BME96_10620 [Virgibacillus halodenitrificans]CDQ35820.1 hypothetical protein BN993_05307 [Virgibacillus halodenitrificans]